ncbi:MAG TPA: MarR family transcriptional regulator [Acidimicrobiia bacterium]|nr:MarR family transcriptional regulator [Acidimicrobiia bacterium]
MPTPLSRSELRSWFRLAGGMRSLLNALDRQLRDEAGMTHDDYEILSRLHRAPDRTQRMSGLASDVGFSPSRLSHAVNRMEEAGRIRRRPSPTDRRGTEATLTELGVKFVEDASPGHLDLVRKLIFDVVGPERAGELAEAMDEIGRTARGETG